MDEGPKRCGEPKGRPSRLPTVFVVEVPSRLGANCGRGLGGTGGALSVVRTTTLSLPDLGLSKWVGLPKTAPALAPVKVPAPLPMVCAHSQTMKVPWERFQ